MLGMYIHMHWGYGAPYAARRWSLEQWGAYISGLRGLGFDFLQIWPMIDTMPLRLTASDEAHLAKIARVIDIAHEAGMRVCVGASANTLGNDRAADFPFADRPYFEAERLIDPADTSSVREMLEARKKVLEPLAAVDAFWILDSDPGGYQGSSVAQFVSLLLEHRRLLDALRSGITLNYWMWSGWQDRTRFDDEWRANPQECWRGALKGLRAAGPEPWGVYACWPGHFSVTEELGLREKVLYFPYNSIEEEPSFPMTNWIPKRIDDTFALVGRGLYPRGVMGNAQSHCLALPHTYLFAHLAEGGSVASADLSGFASDVLPGFGERIAAGWQALGGSDPEKATAIAHDLEALATQGHPREQLRSAGDGRLGGLAFGDPLRFLEDLRLQLILRAKQLTLERQLAEGAGVPRALPALARALRAWADRHGFDDRYGGPYRAWFHALLTTVADRLGEERGRPLREALTGFRTTRRGAVSRVLEALEGAVK